MMMLSIITLSLYEPNNDFMPYNNFCEGLTTTLIRMSCSFPRARLDLDKNHLNLFGVLVVNSWLDYG